jgi:hypothetical protein
MVLSLCLPGQAIENHRNLSQGRLHYGKNFNWPPPAHKSIHVEKSKAKGWGDIQRNDVTQIIQNEEKRIYHIQLNKFHYVLYRQVQYHKTGMLLL